MLLSPFIQNTLIAGVITMIAITFAITGFAYLEKKPALWPLGSIAHIVYGTRALEEKYPKPSFLLVGFMLNFAAMISWAGVAESFYFWLKIQPSNVLMTLVISVLTVILAFVTDFHIVPKRLTPGFENVLNPTSLRLVFVVFAVALFLAGLLRQ